MPQSGDSKPRRKTGDHTETGLQTGPNEFMLPASSTYKTDTYFHDQGDEPPQKTSAVRYRNPSSQTHLTGPQTTANVMPSRRHAATTANRPPVRQGRVVPAGNYNASKSVPLAPKKNIHWLLPVGVTMIGMVLLWFVGSSVLAWGMQRYNDVTYGYPRTYHTDEVVGHGGDSAQHRSHFVAMNLNRQAIVIELMAGDPAKSVSYVAPVYITGDGGDLAPVTVSFKDVTGDQKLDMLMHIHLPNQEQISVFINEGKKFRPVKETDKIRIS